MIVRVQSTELSGVQRFVRRLLTDRGPGAARLGGVALLGSPPSPSRSRRRTAPATDLLVWTPHGCTLVVLADFGSVQHGVLTTGPTGRWLVDEAAADLRTGKSTPNPLLRGRKLRNELAAIFRRHGLSEQIGVLVVLIPKTGSRIDWRPHPPEDGIETILVRIGAAASLADYFERAAVGEVRWRGEDIARAFEALGITRSLPDPGELADEGFHLAADSVADLCPATEEPVGPPARSGVSRITTALSGLSVRPFEPRRGDAAPVAPDAVAQQDGPASLRTPDGVTAVARARQRPQHGDRLGALGKTPDHPASPPTGRSEVRPAAGTDADDTEGLRSAGDEAAVPGRTGAASGGTAGRTRKDNRFAQREPGAVPVRPMRVGTAEYEEVPVRGGRAAPRVPQADREATERNESEPIADSARYSVRSPHPERARAGGTGRKGLPTGELEPGKGPARPPQPAVGQPPVGSGEPPAGYVAARASGGSRPEPDADSELPGSPVRDHREPIPPGAHDSGRGRWGAAAGVPVRLRRGPARARKIPARAMNTLEAPRPAARPPREPRVYSRPVRRGTDLRYPALLGLAGLALAAVTATVFAASGFARFDVAEYGALCGGGEGNPAAAPYSAAGSSPIYLGGDLPDYTAFGPSAVWRPIDPGAVQLVACVDQQRRGDLVRTCQYPPGPGQPVGRTLNLFTAVYRLTVYEARTGDRLSVMEITGAEFGADPATTERDPCRAATGTPEDGLPGRRHSRPSHQQIEQALTPFVTPASQRIRAAR